MLNLDDVVMITMKLALLLMILRTLHASPLNKTFGKVLLINLERRNDRRLSAMLELTQSRHVKTIGLELVQAYDGRRVPLHRLVATGRMSPFAYHYTQSDLHFKGEYMSQGAVGCLLSHLRAWKRVVELNRPCIVFEDDVNLLPNFDQMIALAIAELPPDWGLFYLADVVNTSAVRAAQFHHSRMLWRVSDEYWGTYAYAITPSTARMLLSDVFPMNWQVDSFIMNTTRARGVKVFRSKKNIVTTNGNDVRDTDVQIAPSADSRQQRIPRIFHCLESTSYNHLCGFESLADWQVRAYSITSALQLARTNFGVPLRATASAPYRIKQLIACAALVLHHGGMCMGEEYRLVHPLDGVLQNSVGVFALSQTGTLLGGVVGGIQGSPLLARLIGILHNKLTKYENETTILSHIQGVVEKAGASSQNQVSIFPAHIFDPLPIYKSIGETNPTYDKYALAHVRSGAFAAEHRMPPIPPILHFVLPEDDGPVPAHETRTLNAWMNAHRSWKVMLWTTADLKHRVPFDTSGWTSAQQIEALKYQVVYAYGGFYVDLGLDYVMCVDRIIKLAGNHGIVYVDGAGTVDSLFGFAPQHPVMRRAAALAWHHETYANVSDAGKGSSFFRVRAISRDMDKLAVLKIGALDRIVDRNGESTSFAATLQNVAKHNRSRHNQAKVCTSLSILLFAYGIRAAARKYYAFPLCRLKV